MALQISGDSSPGAGLDPADTAQAAWKALGTGLALAHKLECLAKLPFSPKPWFLSDGELALVNGVYLKTKGTDP